MEFDQINMENIGIWHRLQYPKRMSIPSIQEFKKYEKEHESYRKLASHYKDLPNNLVT